MKKNKQLRLYAQILIILLFFNHQSAFAKNQTITLGVISDDGLNINSTLILREAYHRAGIEVILKKVPPERALMMSNNGYTDGEIHRIWGINKLYPNLIAVPVVLNIMYGSVFTKKHIFEVKGWDSLKPYRIGIRIGIKFVERGTRGMKTYPVATLEQQLRMLDVGRTDIVVTDKFVGELKLKELKIEGITSLDPPLEIYKLYHYLHKKHAKTILPLITKELKEMEQEGRIQEIWDMKVVP